jgi:hypothetical protein
MQVVRHLLVKVSPALMKLQLCCFLCERHLEQAPTSHTTDRVKLQHATLYLFLRYGNCFGVRRGEGDVLAN